VANWRVVLWIPLGWTTAVACALGLIIGNGLLVRSSIVVIVLLGAITLSFGLYGVGWLRSHTLLKLMLAWVLTIGIGWFVWPPTGGVEASVPLVKATPPPPPFPLAKTLKQWFATTPTSQVTRNGNIVGNTIKGNNNKLTGEQNCPGGICAGGDINGNPTVNNYAPPPPNVTYTVDPRPAVPAYPAAHPTEGTYPGLLVEIKVDRAFNSTAFRIVCDKPFTATAGSIYDCEGCASMGSNPTVLPSEADPNSRVIVIHSDKTSMFPGQIAGILLRSMNQQNIRVLKVEAYMPR